MLQFLEQLSRGHAQFGSRPMTLVVTTSELRVWQNPRRKFAVVDEKNFTVLGSSDAAEYTKHHTVKELLAEPDGTTI